MTARTGGLSPHHDRGSLSLWRRGGGRGVHAPLRWARRQRGRARPICKVPCVWAQWRNWAPYTIGRTGGLRRQGTGAARAGAYPLSYSTRARARAPELAPAGPGGEKLQPRAASHGSTEPDRASSTHVRQTRCPLGLFPLPQPCRCPEASAWALRPAATQSCWAACAAQRECHGAMLAWLGTDTVHARDREHDDTRLCFERRRPWWPGTSNGAGVSNRAHSQVPERKRVTLPCRRAGSASASSTRPTPTRPRDYRDALLAERDLCVCLLGSGALLALASPLAAAVVVWPAWCGAAANVGGGEANSPSTIPAATRSTQGQFAPEFVCTSHIKGLC